MNKVYNFFRELGEAFVQGFVSGLKLFGFLAMIVAAVLLISIAVGLVMLYVTLLVLVCICMWSVGCRLTVKRNKKVTGYIRWFTYYPVRYK